MRFYFRCSVEQFDLNLTSVQKNFITGFVSVNARTALGLSLRMWPSGLEWFKSMVVQTMDVHHGPALVQQSAQPWFRTKNIFLCGLKSTKRLY